MIGSSIIDSLYLIEILHQTTTCANTNFGTLTLYLIEILHQTTTKHRDDFLELGLYLIEILHQTTTVDNHDLAPGVLYLIEILHQTTTPRERRFEEVGCILLKFYIKPQLFSRHIHGASVVSY